MGGCAAVSHPESPPTAASSNNPFGLPPANVVALAHHRRPVAAALEEVMGHLAVAAPRAVFLWGAAVQEVRRPYERLALADRAEARLEALALDQPRDVVLVGAVMLAGRIEARIAHRDERQPVAARIEHNRPVAGVDV